jgi:radical SAM superfamily enzyme YgiQ (UPF0313 family)
MENKLNKIYLQDKNLNIVSPELLRRDLSENLSIKFENIYILGDLTNRTLLLKKSDKDFVLFPILSDEISNLFFEAHQDNILSIYKNDSSYNIEFRNPTEFLNKIQKPHVKIISLYHQENFPLPRFPLGISDIAAAIRKNYLGKVSLLDMQFGKSIEDIVNEIKNEQPDIIGVSATFGQQDLMELLISSVQKIRNYNPLVIFGGSLSTLNAEKLLEMFPTSLVSKGYGETTMQDVVKYWLGIIPKDKINFIAYSQNNRIILTEQRKDDKNIYANPELDLLEDTLKFKGVMQLESSRGCTYYCSFCPRGHKGQWSGETGSEFEKLIPFVKNIFDKYPNINSKIFLVDEEFVGYKFHQIGVQNRALQVAELLQSYGFKFESSTRIDQVYQPSKKGIEWQIERINFWKSLIENGLDRMLFGVESGVDTILKRFNKHSTAEQNVIAIRILTSIGVPLRLTYITFDPLMTLEELILSYEFQGRKDILLKANNSLSAEQIFESVFNKKYVSENSTNLCLFSEISYMLVSMESLLGSEYLKLVEAAGLAEEHIFLMGKRQTKYRDPNIGLISLYSQKWIDRNFSLDYLLKSIIKISEKDIRNTIISLRVRIKHYSFSLLGKMLSLITSNLKYLHEPTTTEISQITDLILRWNNEPNENNKEEIFFELLSLHFDLLVNEFTHELMRLKSQIKEDDYEMIEHQVKNWIIKNDWELINNK